MRAAIAILLAGITSSLYALSTSLQALEARRVPQASALRASLIGRLLRRPLWLAGTAAGLAAWPLQAVALSLGSVALVQPAMGLGLIVLLVLGVRVLHERIGAREIGGVATVSAAIGLLAWAAPSETGGFTTRGTWAVGLTLLVVGPAPYLLRLARRAGGLPTSVAAGLGWAWVGLGTSLLAVAVADRHWLAAVAWAAGVVATSWSALLNEMTSLQTWPATRAIPIAFGLEMILPAVLAPFLTHHSPPHAAGFGLGLVLALAGAGLLGTSRAVARAAAPLTGP